MDVGTAAIIVSVLTLLLNLAMSLRSSQWGLPDRLAQMEKRLMEAVEGHRTAADLEMDKLRSMIDGKADSIRREFGETVSAMQHKIHEFETWSRDNFVRRGSFEQVISRMDVAQQDRDARFEKRLDRMEGKLDALHARPIPPI
jgi:hypothetical protein